MENQTLGVQILATVWLAGLLLWVSCSDLASRRIPNLANGLLVISGVLMAGLAARSLPVDALIGAVAGFGAFAMIGEVYFRRTGTDGLGLGDAKLMGAAGAWLGWQALPSLVALSSLSALVFAVTCKHKKLAFGPWLSASFLLHWIAAVSA